MVLNFAENLTDKYCIVMKNVPNLLRPEEVLAVSNLLRKRLERDKDDFFYFSECFNKDFIKQLVVNIEDAESMSDEAQISRRIASYSAEMHMILDDLANHLSNLYTYTLEKEPDTTNHLDLSLLMVNVKQRKVDNVITLLRRLINKFDALSNASSDVKKFASEVTLLFANLNFIEKEKCKLQREKDLIAQENHILINSLWRKVESISNAGLLIYRRSNPDKAREYSLSELRNRASQTSTS